jgi:hypothetical protein
VRLAERQLAHLQLLHYLSPPHWHLRERIEAQGDSSVIVKVISKVGLKAGLNSLAIQINLWRPLSAVELT